MASSNPATPTPAGAEDLGLPSERDQRRNTLIYAAQISIAYFAAPALYIGFMQASLCKRLETSDTIANLPSTVYLAMAWTTVVIAWLFPQARLLKRLLSGAYLLMAAAGLMVAAVIVVQPGTAAIVTALVIHAAMVGISVPLIGVLGWEVLDRGVSRKLRGRALGLAFGVGPAFAVLGSLGAQLLMDGKIFDFHLPEAWAPVYPYSYALLFTISAGCTIVSAWLITRYRIPVPTQEPPRQSFQDGIVGGFRAVLGYPILLIACLAYLLIYAGNLVQINMSIFTKEAVGQMAENLAGYQLALRFSFKILAGFLLGWLLVRTNPKVPLLVTAGLLMLGVLWVLFAPGYWFLLAFGINGAGELFGVYYVNYPAQCSPRSQVRRNISFLMLISALVGLAPVGYGFISDNWGLRASFIAALVLLIATTAMVFLKLPWRPQPRPQDMTEADRAALNH
jgi:MFS family permease